MLTQPYRIYYADGSTYEGNPADAPSFGVIAILQKNHDSIIGKYHIISGHPYYMVTDDGCWLPARENDLIDSLAHRLGEIKGFLVGQIVSRKRFNEIFQRAKLDKDAENLD